MPKISFVLFMGIVMSITAFPVLARILAERNLIRTPNVDRSKRVVTPVCGGAADALALSFVEQLLYDEALTLSVVLVEPRLAIGEGVTGQLEHLSAKYPDRVQFRTSRAAAGPAVLRDCASEADLVVLGLDPAWGLDVERGSAESVRLLAEFPTSLLVLHARPA